MLRGAVRVSARRPVWRVLSRAKVTRPEPWRYIDAYERQAVSPDAGLSGRGVESLKSPQSSVLAAIFGWRVLSFGSPGEMASRGIYGGETLGHGRSSLSSVSKPARTKVWVTGPFRTNSVMVGLLRSGTDYCRRCAGTTFLSAWSAPVNDPLGCGTRGVAKTVPEGPALTPCCADSPLTPPTTSAHSPYTSKTAPLAGRLPDATGASALGRSWWEVLRGSHQAGPCPSSSRCGCHLAASVRAPALEVRHLPLEVT